MTRTSSLTEETVGDGLAQAEKALTPPRSSAEPPVNKIPGDNHVTQQEPETIKEQRNCDFGIIPIPLHLRYNPSKPFHFGMTLNIAFGFFSTFTVANLYYCQPLLSELLLHKRDAGPFLSPTSPNFPRLSSDVFGDIKVASFIVPTLIQAGYACGLLLISPLGDLVRRRPLILATVIFSTGLTIGLAFTKSLIVFEVISFIVGAVSVTPQILIPLVADLAPDKRRASAISIVFSGLLFGILVARVLAGIIAQFVSWRVVYYFAIGVQGLVLIGCHLMLPDYPSKNQNLTYWSILWTMAKFSVTEPVLIQACIINFCSSACFSNFWVTLTFLLGGAPYFYSTLVIGLFGLIGMAGVSMGPIGGRVIDKLVPWYASLVGICALLVFQAIQTAAGGIHVAAVIIATFGIDVFRQNLQVSLSTAIFLIEPAARARLNAVSILSIFIGQVMGTSVGTDVFIKFGWRAGAALSLAWTGFMLFILLLRGPHCRRYTWFGYEGGLSVKKSSDSVSPPPPPSAQDQTSSRSSPNAPAPPSVEERMEDGVGSDRKEHSS
ncbi:hypothetical protein NP233_g4229 [Leucocoprinus birnbaumii]|uniref:Major facilitator superfamily (MFS) profile domain-containing protein n=1 Tax=Leucocoprinus birnbaumii TaxID=56174 RepID=A0AAD5VV27_9AGAR|nr:hypothetical protein NP233_g4229 [Leucocoprinus birnbaumii]